VIRDHGSRQGTAVNGIRIGSGESRDHVLLAAGENEVAIGAAASQFRFRIALSAI
jgi:hypothetical protein